MQHTLTALFLAVTNGPFARTDEEVKKMIRDGIARHLDHRPFDAIYVEDNLGMQVADWMDTAGIRPRVRSPLFAESRLQMGKKWSWDQLNYWIEYLESPTVGHVDLRLDLRPVKHNLTEALIMAAMESHRRGEKNSTIVAISRYGIAEIATLTPYQQRFLRPGELMEYRIGIKNGLFSIYESSHLGW